MIPLHRTQAAKVEKLTESMIAHGWVGQPIVVDGEQLITGNHRHEAANRAGVQAEVIDIRYIFSEQELDYDAIMAKEMVYDDWYQALQYALKEIPQEVQNEYGIDIGG